MFIYGKVLVFLSIRKGFRFLRKRVGGVREVIGVFVMLGFRVSY